MSLFRLFLLPLLLWPTFALADVVDINSADAVTLARELKGVGETRAQAIVEHRSRHGAFRSVEELALVKGIGPKLIERNRASLRAGLPAARVSGPAVSRPATPLRPQRAR